MSKKIMLLIKYLLAWILLSVIYFIVSEKITNWLFPEMHGVETWLLVVSAGLGLIFIITLVSYLISLKSLKKTQV